MSNKLLDYMLDPVKGSILLEIHTMGRATATELSLRLPKIAKSTLYRYLSKMESDDIIVVVDRVQKRGTVEKTYKITDEFNTYTDKKPTKEQLKKMFIQFCWKYIAQGNKYIDTQDENYEKFLMTFTTAPIYATDDEYMKAMERIGEVITELRKNKAGDDRKLYSWITMVIPSDEE